MEALSYNSGGYHFNIFNYKLQMITLTDFLLINL
jgi:hypothetical protein